MQNEAAEFKLRAERKAGEKLAALTRRGRRGTQMYQAGTFRPNELGISRNQSSRWQREAAVSEPDFKAFSKRSHERGPEVSTEALLRLSVASRRTGGPPRSAAVIARRTSDKAVTQAAAPKSVLAANRPGFDDLAELLAELANHHAVLVSVLSDFLEQRQDSLDAASRRHAARLSRETMAFHEAAAD